MHEVNICNRQEGVLSHITTAQQAVLIFSCLYVRHYVSCHCHPLRRFNQCLSNSMQHVWRQLMSLTLLSLWMSEDHRLHKAVFHQKHWKRHCQTIVCCKYVAVWIETLETALKGRIAWHTHHLPVHNQGQHNNSRTLTYNRLDSKIAVTIVTKM